MNIPFKDILDALGGGTAAVMIIGLAVAVAALWRQLQKERAAASKILSETQAARLADVKDSAKEVTDLAIATNKTLDALSASLRAGGSNG
ncbi:hypothetical protein DL1_19605 [Thioclava dalianensis]|uniref:Uncharacterized protein n=1 Tax=Thioclava dalianensis TaxID=1185766 RepID=A0A074T7Q7_9RHOB|nr:hypothetical protein [Thioclava dalianensis]KEP67811.1 hypothetical protein DL1_19605 [Thioclava dalianensis]SFN48720.1 hypothetical protein SAMN05216224_10634 [Thioclava dalianensis]